MRLWSDSFRDGGLIPAEYAFAALDRQGRVARAPNRNPHLAWDEVPAGTESLALFCFDVDAPFDTRLVNQSGQRLTLDMARRDFYHWSVVDLPPRQRSLGAGQFSSAITIGGKRAARVDFKGIDGSGGLMRQGVNDFTGWFASDPVMAGDYYGYDGPAPPWNDERIHHYIFRLYALDLRHLELGERFDGAQARAAIYGHILDEAQLIGAYSLHPDLALTLKT